MQQKVDVEEDDVSSGLYGSFKLIQSEDESHSEKRSRVFTHIKSLVPDIAGSEVWIRARLQTSRAKGKSIVMYQKQNQ